MSRATVVGVDPGRVCGVASFTWSSFTPPTGSDLETAEYDWITCCGTIENTMRTVVNREHHVVLAVERYTEHGGGAARTSQPEALMTIGALSFIAERVRQWSCFYGSGAVRLVLQGAADATAAAPNHVLHRVGWWTPRDPEMHRNRAAAQVALALLTLYPDVWHTLLEDGRVG